MKYFFLLLLASCSPKDFLISLKTPTRDRFETNCKKSRYFVFINGLNVNKRQAREAKELLIKKSKHEFDLLYNTSENFPKDLLQAMEQKNIENKIINPEEFSIASILGKAMSDKDEDIYLPSELREIERVGKKLEKFETVIVAHSQGNLFANKVCRDSKNKPATIQIANPSAIKTRCERSNITFNNDPVIEMVRSAVKKLSSMPVRKANYHFAKGNTSTNIDGFSGDEILFNKLFFNHDFKSYLELEPTTSKKILSDIAQYRNGEVDKVFTINSTDIASQVLSINGKSVYPPQEISCTDFVDDSKIDIYQTSNHILVKQGENSYMLADGAIPISVNAVAEKVDINEGEFKMVLRNKTLFEIGRDLLLK